MNRCISAIAQVVPIVRSSVFKMAVLLAVGALFHSGGTTLATTRPAPEVNRPALEAELAAASPAPVMYGLNTPSASITKFILDLKGWKVKLNVQGEEFVQSPNSICTKPPLDVLLTIPGAEGIDGVEAPSIKLTGLGVCTYTLGEMPPQLKDAELEITLKAPSTMKYVLISHEAEVFAQGMRHPAVVRAKDVRCVEAYKGVPSVTHRFIDLDTPETIAKALAKNRVNSDSKEGSDAQTSRDQEPLTLYLNYLRNLLNKEKEERETSIKFLNNAISHENTSNSFDFQRYSKKWMDTSWSELQNTSKTMTQAISQTAEDSIVEQHTPEDEEFDPLDSWKNPNQNPNQNLTNPNQNLIPNTEESAEKPAPMPEPTSSDNLPKGTPELNPIETATDANHKILQSNVPPNLKHAEDSKLNNQRTEYKPIPLKRKRSASTLFNGSSPPPSQPLNGRRDGRRERRRDGGRDRGRFLDDPLIASKPRRVNP